MTNFTYICEEYKKRSLTALIAEYARLDLYVTTVLDKQKKFIDDDTSERYQCVQELICEKLLLEFGSRLTSGKSIHFEYFE